MAGKLEKGGDRPTRAASDAILLVEDDPISMRFISAILRAAGYTVHGAADGRQCLEQVRQLRPDLILMDMMMPNLDGLETCRHLKSDEQCRRIPVVFVTGQTDEPTLQAAFEAGASDYVGKPVSRVELLARVRTALTQCRMMRRQAEEERTKAVLEMAGDICHELNQPLQYILGAVQLLMMDIAGDEALTAQLDTIRARIEEMGEITRKLCAITRF